MPRTAKPKKSAVPKSETYTYPESQSLMRPEAGTQPRFKKKKPPAEYRYDSSLSPALDWDDQNPARELGEHLIKAILDAKDLPTAKAAAEKLKAMSKPFLNWAGKAEGTSFDVPTLPLFVHERLSTSAILETLKGHQRDKQQDFMEDLFGATERSHVDRATKAYEYPDKWVNRLILGDALVAMNSLLHYENLGGQVQMIYMDPPYGVKFGSNFQPFVRKRDVKNNDDNDMTREPETVKAYRDTWELGLHSYLTYLRDRLLLARDLLKETGSIFVQISDENVHHVREVMDEVFGPENFCGQIAYRTTGGQSAALLSSSTDFIIWFAKDKERAKTAFRHPTTPKVGGTDASGQYSWIEPSDRSRPPRRMSEDELADPSTIPSGWRILRPDNLYGQGAPSDPADYDFAFEGRLYRCPPNNHWKPGVLSGGMQRLADAKRLMVVGNTLSYKRYVEDLPVYLLDNVWNDTGLSGFARKKAYAVETSPKAIERCMLMTTAPGDLVVDPTCGSGTTAAVAEQWGRRWITMDVSRVPLALTKQRLLTAKFDYYELADETRGPAGGFVYKRRQNQKGEEVGGIIPHIKISTIAREAPPAEKVLVDRPEVVKGVTRVSGPFWVEATIPTPVDWDEDGVEDSGAGEAYGDFSERLLEVLRKSPVLHLPGNQTVDLKNVRPPAKSLSLSAEALVDGKPVALVFGPENGAVSERLVYEAAREAHAKSYAHLYVIGFAIEPNARQFVESCADVAGVPAAFVQCRPPRT